MDGPVHHRAPAVSSPGVVDRASGFHNTPYVGGNAFVDLFHRKRSVRREDRSHSSFSRGAFSAIHSHWRYSSGLPYRSVLLGTDDFLGLAFSLVRKVALDFVVLFGEPPINSESSAIMALCGRILGSLFPRDFDSRQRSWLVWRTIGAGLAVALLSVGMFFLVNYGQTGDPFTTVQSVFFERWRHGKGMGFYVAGLWGIHTPEKAAANLLLNMIRQNIWLFGWPFSFVFMLFVPGGRFVGFLLGWGLTHWAFYAYFSSPGINLTGPVYYYEMIIPEVLLSACGIVHLYGICRKHLVNSRAHTFIPAVIFSFYIVSFLMFSPVVLTSLREIALVSSAVYRNS